tara:strand:+ start:2009 stop:2203 length:195 start_codon:yes stop_codon:yes gene_type:complete
MSIRETNLIVFSAEEAQLLRDVIAQPQLTQEAEYVAVLEQFISATQDLIVDEIKVFTTREWENA